MKHFSWEARGKWRIHKKPKPHQVRACRPRLEAEILALQPRVTLLGSTFRKVGRRLALANDRR